MANKSLKAWIEQEGAGSCNVVAIRELLQNRNIVLLEGQDDGEYLGKFLNDKTKYQIAGNKSKVIEILRLIANKKERKLIGISDRDYEVNKTSPDNLFCCDHRDIEMMVVSCEGIAERVFEGDTVLNKKLTEKRLYAGFSYSLNDFKADMESVLKSLVPVSLFFILHDRNGMNTPYRDCLDDFQSVLTETTETIKGKIAKYINETCSNPNAVGYYNSLFEKNYNYYDITRGHTFVSVFTSKVPLNYSAKEFSRDFSACYMPEHFSKTQLYKDIKAFERKEGCRFLSF